MKDKRIIFISLLLLLISLTGFFALAQGVGYIQIKCEPGATVFLDNKFVGTTSSELGGLILQNVPAGSHEVKIVKEGFKPQSVKIDLKANEIYLYEVSLKQKLGALLVETIPIECIIEIPLLNIDEEHVGNKTEKTWEVSAIPIGSYRINFIALGKKVKYDLKIEEGVKKRLFVNILKNEVREIVPVLTWDRTYSGSGDDWISSLIQTTDGGYAVAGSTKSKGAGNRDIWVIKLDNQGNQVWDRTYGGSGKDGAYSLIQTSDKGYAVAGWTKSKGAGNEDIWVIKLDNQGNQIWDRTYGGSGDDEAWPLVQTTDGGYAVAGVTKSKGAGNVDVWVIKLDNQGNQVWDRTYGGSGDDEANSFIQTTDGGYAVAGVTKSKGAGNVDVWVIKLDNQGNQVWDRIYGGSGADGAYSLIQTTDGGYAVAGFTTTFRAGKIVYLAGADFWVIKLDGEGNKIWDRTYGGSGVDWATSFIQTTDGGYAVAGVTKSKGAGNEDVWVIKLDNQGNRVWDRSYGGSGDDEAHSLIQTIDGGYAVAGVTKSEGASAGNGDIWVIKLDEQGNLISGVEDPEAAVEVKGADKNFDITDYEAQTGTESNTTSIQTIPVPSLDSYQWEVGIPGFAKPGEITKFKDTTISTVQLSSPSNGAILPPGDITFSWNSVGNATKYEFILYNHLGQVALDTTKNRTSLIVALGAEETIAWKVRAGDNSVNWGAWSSSWSLTLKSNITISTDSSPQAFLSNSQWDLGLISQGDLPTFTFTIENKGELDLVINKIDISEYVQYDVEIPLNILPGEKQEVIFTYDSRQHNLGEVRESVRIYCNDPRKEAFSLRIDGYIKEKAAPTVSISPVGTRTTYFLEGSLHCPETGGYPCNGCSLASDYINHFKGFNVLTTQEDCYVSLTYNQGAYIGNQNNCEVTIKGEKWLGLENESGTKLVEEINSGRFDFQPANKFVERTMTIPGDNYQYEFANEGKEFRLYLSRNREEAFKAVPWQNIVIEIKNKETNNIFKYKFEKGIFPLAYSWNSGGMANYGQCVWWAAKRWVEEVDSKILFPFYPPSPQDVNVIKIDSNYQPQKYDILINYDPKNTIELGHYAFVEKVEGDQVYITQFNWMKPGEVYNHISRPWKGNAPDLYYSNNPNEEYYFKYYYRWMSTVEENSNYSLGDIGPAGGLIFYDKGSYSDGWRYLEAAPVSTDWYNRQWGSYGTLIGATETDIGTGQSNTTTIVTWLNSHSETDCAAQLCDALVYGGYSDWFLPSKDELNLMYTNLKVFGVGGFADEDEYYWSSSEYLANSVWFQGFGTGYQNSPNKSGYSRVRAVRAF